MATYDSGSGSGPCRRRLALPVLAAALLAAALLAAAWPARAEVPDGPLPAFSVEVTLSSRAAARLLAASEEIIVSASYYGDATQAARRRANTMGWINLAARKVTLPGRGGTARFPAVPVSPAQLDGIVDRTPQLLINVVSARRTNRDNLLDCGIFQDPVALAAEAPIRIACKLIGEP